MKRYFFLLALTLLCNTLSAQDLSLTFTSETDARFFVYVNGRLHNERPAGMVTLSGLEEKDYHIRIVIDDPYEVSVTKTLRPDGKHDDYSVRFNAVRERVYLKRASSPKSEKDEGKSSQWKAPDTTARKDPGTVARQKHTPLGGNSSRDVENQHKTNRIKSQTVED